MKSIGAGGVLLQYNYQAKAVWYDGWYDMIAEMGVKNYCSDFFFLKKKRKIIVNKSIVNTLKTKWD